MNMLMQDPALIRPPYVLVHDVNKIGDCSQFMIQINTDLNLAV
jgi:hypothetical protein